MQVFHQLDEAKEKAVSSVVAVGNFDGVHLGHAQLLKSTLEFARADKRAPTVLTFYPHPVEVLNPSKKLERLTTTTEKLHLLEQLGFSTVLVAPFNKELSQLTAEEFFSMFLVEGLKAKTICVGSDFRFGKDRQGDSHTLAQLCHKYSLSLHIESPVYVPLYSPAYLNDQQISSSAIRQLLREGELEKAQHLLGRNYSLSGQVKRGDQRGRQLGFPTANLHCAAEKLLPKNGVYITEVGWQRQVFPSVTNVGVRPTFKEEFPQKMIEVHLLDFQQRLYDEFLEVRFLKRLRDEKRFESLESLKQQIGNDVATSRKYFNSGFPERTQ